MHDTKSIETLRAMKRSIYKLTTLATTALLLASCGLFSTVEKTQSTSRIDHEIMLIGTLGSTEKEGTIQSFSINPQTLRAEHTGKVLTPSPTYMALNPRTGVLYVTNETSSDPMVSAYDLDKVSGELKLLNQAYTLGRQPTYISVIDDKVLTANYGAGSITLFNTDKKGLLEQADWRIELGAETTSHPHAVVFTPNGRELFVPDLAQDKIFHFNANRTNPPLTIDTEHTDLPVGTGPRHIVFDRKGRYGYLIAEKSPRIFVFKHESGKLTLIQTISTGSHSVGAHIAMSHSGSHLYASFRDGSPGILTYKIESDGKLSEVDFTPTGAHPRHFVISPSDDFIAVAARDAGEVQVFVRDQATGMLSRSPLTIQVQKPVFVYWDRF